MGHPVPGGEIKRDLEIGKTAIQPEPAQTADLSISGSRLISSLCTPRSRSAAALSFSGTGTGRQVREGGGIEQRPLAATASALFQFVLGSAEKDASSRTVHLSNGGEKV